MNFGVFFKVVTVLFTLTNLCACSDGGSSSQSKNTADPDKTMSDSSVANVALHCNEGFISGTQSPLSPLLINGKSDHSFALEADSQISVNLTNSFLVKNLTIKLATDSLTSDAFDLEISSGNGSWRTTGRLDGSGDTPCNISFSSGQLVCTFIDAQDITSVRISAGEEALPVYELEINSFVSDSEQFDSKCSDPSVSFTLESDDLVELTSNGQRFTVHSGSNSIVGPFSLGAPFDFEVVNPPYGKTCELSQSSGIAGMQDSTLISVSCEDIPETFRHSINITGLEDMVSIQAGTESFTFSSNASHFLGDYPQGATGVMSVISQPEDQHCSFETPNYQIQNQFLNSNLICLPLEISTRYTKISQIGEELPDYAIDWSCVLDNDTGHMWERKTTDRTISDYRWTFSNNTNTIKNEGYVSEEAHCSNEPKGADYTCNTESHIERLNSIALCGFEDWRLPMMHEFSNLIMDCTNGFSEQHLYDESRANLGDRFCLPQNESIYDTITTDFFGSFGQPYTLGDLEYIWSGDQRTDDHRYAYLFNLEGGDAYATWRSFDYGVMLVRAPKPIFKVGVEAINVTGPIILSDGSNQLTINSSGYHNFETEFTFFDPYSVSIISQPNGGSCYLKDFTGFIQYDDATVTIECINNPYIKISSAGDELDASAEEWACVKDTDSGLLWEVKTIDGGLQDKDWAYMNTSKLLGLDPRDTTLAREFACSLSPDTEDGEYCHTEGYVEAINTKGLCGVNNWRLPEINEMKSLIVCSNKLRGTIENGSACGLDGSYVKPTINTFYFPNTIRTGIEYFYWSSTSSASNNGLIASYAVFNYGYVSSAIGLRHKHASVRLVSSTPEIVEPQQK